MSTKPTRIAKLFWRNITWGDFFNFEHPPEASPAGGGGQRYIDIPLGGNLSVGVLGEFLTGVPFPVNPGAWSPVTIVAGSATRPADRFPLEFRPRRGGNNRYYIANQNRQSGSAARHPAWTADNGFPSAPDDLTNAGDPRIPDLSFLKILVAKDENGRFIASFANGGQMPASWPSSAGLEILFQANASLSNRRVSDGVINIPPQVQFPVDALVDALPGLAREAEAVRLLAESLANELDRVGEFDPSTIEDARQRTLASIVRRRGQPEFRRDLVKAYGAKCAITDCDVLEALEAAHIMPYRGDDTNTPVNGILLRADLHTLFDLRLFTIDHAMRTVVLSPRLKDTHYAWLDGCKVRFPDAPGFRPSSAAIKQHRLEGGL